MRNVVTDVSWYYQIFIKMKISVFAEFESFSCEVTVIHLGKRLCFTLIIILLSQIILLGVIINSIYLLQIRFYVTGRGEKQNASYPLMWKWKSAAFVAGKLSGCDSFLFRYCSLLNSQHVLNASACAPRLGISFRFVLFCFSSFYLLLDLQLSVEYCDKQLFFYEFNEQSEIYVLYRWRNDHKIK